MRVTPLLLVSTLLLSAACLGDPSSPAAAANDARLQVVPGIAGLAAVDVVVDGEVKLRNAAYGVPSSVLALPQGAHVVRIVPAKGAAAPGGTPVTLRANDTTRVVAIGTATAINTVALGDTGAPPVPKTGRRSWPKAVPFASTPSGCAPCSSWTHRTAASGSPHSATRNAGAAGRQAPSPSRRTIA